MRTADIRSLLQSLLRAFDERQDLAAVSLQIRKSKREEARDEAWWRKAVPDGDVSAAGRKLAYLTTYYFASNRGRRFFATGIPVDREDELLWPDRAVMNAYLNSGQVVLNDNRFEINGTLLSEIENLLTMHAAAPLTR